MRLSAATASSASAAALATSSWARGGPGESSCGDTIQSLAPERDAAGDDDTGAINELILGVNIALKRQPLTNCPEFDRNTRDGVEINELVSAVHNAMNGCGG